MAARECREENEIEYNTYDQTVDIVSCWESFLNHSYTGVFGDYHFDRFPTLSGDSAELTPDFAVTVTSEYGLIGEIKRTFPDDDTPFKRTLEQLARYDEPDQLQASDDRMLAPDTVDLLLLIKGTAAPQIGIRIQRLLESGELSLDRNLVVVRYQYNTRDQRSRYEFQRVTAVEDEFRDGALRDEHALSTHMGKAADYQTLPVYPKHFHSEKVKKPICNDKPPEQYLATILWHKIFPAFLSDADYSAWQSGSAQKTISIQVTPGLVTTELNSYMRDGRARKTWVKDALIFLKDADLAERHGDSFEIKFRGFVRNIGTDNDQEGTEELDKLETLGETFIQRYCHYTASDSESLESYE
ncbi:hypothetical protein [Halosegnis marinus]|uniref:Uncharacterized protein n=1 Tax=Halosegnis marinus TaxID=3034023 RepID=A0ABD5ZU39_9EURY|nr:hypothetical protein [Halosegnis sp. DT85]